MIRTQFTCQQQGGIYHGDDTTCAPEIPRTVFAAYRVGLVHGKMKGSEKDAVMRRFKAGDVQVLVSTTVIEVGIDVPNATVMVVENADRFGLAQLHQLRGRVGRGGDQSYCILYNDSSSDFAKQRMKTMRETERPRPWRPRRNCGGSIQRSRSSRSWRMCMQEISRSFVKGSA